MRTIIKHHLMCAIWTVLPTKAKIAIWKWHRANLKPDRFSRKAGA